MYEDIRKIQLVELDIMKKIHAMCVENGLHYILCGGTLIGAVRHHGFIPWDDDLDIALPRADFDMLIKLLSEPSVNDEGYFLQTYETDLHFVQPYAKLRKNGTRFVEQWFRTIDMHQGVFVDIFPLDKIPSLSSVTAIIRGKIVQMLTFAIWRKEKCTLKRHGIKKIEPIISTVIDILSKKTIVSLQHALMIREGKDWNYCRLMNGNEASPIPYGDILDAVLVDFEDTQFYIPKNYDSFLSRTYGDYMQLPPVDKRNSGHTIVQVQL